MAVFNTKKILIVDISRRHFHPPAKRKLFIRLPQEAGGGIALLLRMMNGMRDAAAGWEEYHQEKLALAGYKTGISCPCALTNSDRSSPGVVHGDDFVF